MADYTESAVVEAAAEWGAINPPATLPISEGEPPGFIVEYQMESQPSGAAVVTTGLVLVSGLELVPGVQ